MPAFTDCARVACALLLVAPAGQAYEDGAPPAHSGGFGEADCSACHSDNRSNDRRGELLLDGLPAAYRPGASYQLTLRLAHPALEVAGLQMTMRQADGRNAGSFEPAADSGLAIRQAGGVDYLQHVAPRPAVADAPVAHWTVRWQAPAEAVTVQLDIAANAANGDASALGDYVYRLRREVAPLTSPSLTSPSLTSPSPVPVQGGSERSGRSAPGPGPGSVPAARSSSHELP